MSGNIFNLCFMFFAEVQKALLVCFRGIWGNLKAAVEICLLAVALKFQENFQN